MGQTKKTLGRFFWAALGFGFCAVLSLASAQAAPKRTEWGQAFRITGSSLRVESAKAEWCLSFNQPLNLGKGTEILSALNVREEGKRKKIQLRDLNLTPTEMCLQNLEHRKRYDILLRRIESASGARLAAPYDSVFVVPDRKPFLAFVSDSSLSILPRHVKRKEREGGETDLFDAGMAHVLRSVNIDQTRLTLYKISDRESFAGAWQQFTLINLSPAESLYFARTKGKAVFESDLIFGANPNVEQTLVAPLPPDAELSPGLYYLAAAPKDKEKSKPGLFAGQWFLVSDLRLSALFLPDGVKVFAGNLETRAPAAEAEVQLLTREGKRLASAKTDAEGMAFLPFEAGDGKTAPALLVGILGAGDADILDIGRDASIRIAPLPMKAFLRPDRESYGPGATAVVALRAEESSGQLLEIKNSALKLLRPDRRIYSEQTVPSSRAGVTLLNVPLPVAGKAGVWFLSWQEADGRVLAERRIHLSPQPFSARLDLNVQRKDESLSLFIKALDEDGKPLAFREGLAVLRAQRPKVQGWSGFHFGVFNPVAQEKIKGIPFVTGPDGTVRVNAAIDREDFFEIDALSATVSLNDGQAEASLAVPLRRFSSLIGVKPLTEGNAFAENGMARFEIVAVDANGKRRAENDLRFLIFEEGRRFEWFPSEGHWDYRPLPQHRRIGGGALSLSASEEAVISWPVTTGQYVLEITDEKGVALLRQPFEAGRLAPHPVQTEEKARIRFVAPPESLEEKKDNRVKMRLAAPAFVSVTLFDGSVRASIHRFMKTGENEIAIKPAEGWGQQALLRAQAQFLDSSVPGSAETRVAIHHPRRDLLIEVPSPREITAGSSVALPVKVQKAQGRAPTFLSIVATPYPDDKSADVPAVRLDRVPVDADGKATVRLNVPLFAGRLKIVLEAWNDGQYGKKSFVVPARPALAMDGGFPSRMILGDRAEVPLRIANHAGVDGAYAYDLVMPDGIVSTGAPLQGNVSLKKGQQHELLFTIAARKDVEGVFRFEMTGPGGAQLASIWPVSARADRELSWGARSRVIEPQQKVSFPEEKKTKTYGMLGPLSLSSNVAASLQAFVLGKPHSTSEIALWLEVADLWGRSIRKIGLIGETRLESLRADYVRQLQLRQNEDGGFSSFGSGAPSDIASTAAALIALQNRAERPAALAAEWLSYKMQNTWFDESEREDRVAALEALSRARRGDLSAVRYLAETSKDKKLSASGAALLGLALTQSGDPDAAGYWISRAREAVASQPIQAWAVARLLALNTKVMPEEISWFLDQTPLLGAETSFEEAACALVAMAQGALRQGEWTARLGEKEIKETGLFAWQAEPDQAPVEVAANQRKLFLLEIDTEPGKRAEEAAKGQAKRKERMTIERQFIKLDGEEVSFDLSLNAGMNYILLLSGEKRATGGRLRLVLPKSAAFDVIPLRRPSLLDSHFAWLAESLVRAESFADLPSGYGFDVDASRSWRVAFLVRASRRGGFALPSLRVFEQDGREVTTDQNALRFSVW